MTRCFLEESEDRFYVVTVSSSYRVEAASEESAIRAITESSDPINEYDGSVDTITADRE